MSAPVIFSTSLFLNKSARVLLKTRSDVSNRRDWGEIDHKFRTGPRLKVTFVKKISEQRENIEKSVLDVLTSHLKTI